MIVIIDGFSSSGHSVLRGLLDGHPNIFCSPVHDYTLIAFCENTTNSLWENEYL